MAAMMRTHSTADSSMAIPNALNVFLPLSANGIHPLAGKLLDHQNLAGL